MNSWEAGAIAFGMVSKDFWAARIIMPNCLVIYRHSKVVSDLSTAISPPFPDFTFALLLS